MNRRCTRKSDRSVSASAYVIITIKMVSIPRIALIHGMNDGLGIWPGVSTIPLSWWMGASRVVHQSGPTIEACVEQVRKQLDPEQPWILIGHSLGGVVAVALSHDPVLKVVGVVTLGSPLHGAALATVARHFDRWRDDGMVHDLARVQLDEPPCPYLTMSGSVLFSAFDGKVFRDEAMYRPERHFDTWASHVMLIMWPSVWRRIRAWIIEQGLDKVRLGAEVPGDAQVGEAKEERLVAAEPVMSPDPAT